METTVVNMIIGGALVALFASIYRLRSSTRLRFWIAGWLCILLHFAVQMSSPGSVWNEHFLDAISVSLLMLCGISFVLSAIMPRVAAHRPQVVLSLLVPELAFTWLACFGAQSRLTFAVINLGGQLLAMALLWWIYQGRRSILVAGTCIILLGTGGVLWEIHHGSPLAAMELILAELFAVQPLLLWADYRRLSAGVITTIFGLLAWAAVFPVGLAVDAYYPTLVIHPEIWNVPKFFVAFGMIVTLLEDEIELAGKAREQYQMLFEQNPLPMWIFDRTSEKIIEVNACAVSEYGYSRERFLSMKMGELLRANPGTDQNVNQDANRTAVSAALSWLVSSNGRIEPGSPVRLKKSDGTEAMVETSTHPVRFEERDAALILANDVTERMKLHEQLIHQANHDPLTSLPNRVLLADRMETALAAAERHGAKAAVLCLDVDRFKQINDTVGHPAGDSCLREIAIRLKGRLRTVDTAARTGGEEFMVILDGIHSYADAEQVALDLLDACSEPHEVEDRVIELSMSIGIAIYPDDARHPDQLWRYSDAAMYRAKQEGGNRVRFFSSPGGQSLLSREEVPC